MKEHLIPEYSIDSKGYYCICAEGKFRPIDIENGNVTILKPRLLRDKLRDNCVIEGGEGYGSSRTSGGDSRISRRSYTSRYFGRNS